MHELLMTRDGYVGFVYTGPVVPWHRLGTQYDTAEMISAVEAVRLADTGYVVEKCPNVTLLPDGTQKPTGGYALVRHPTTHDPEYRIFNQDVSDEYEIVQNQSLALMLDPLTQKFGWPIETHGVLGQGERTFFCFDAGTFAVLGEEVKLFLTISEDKRARAALRAALSVTRTVCANTLQMAISGAKMQAVLEHRGGVEQNLGYAIQLMGAVQKMEKESQATLNALGRHQMTDEEMDSLGRIVFPTPNRPRILHLGAGISQEDVTREARESMFDKREGAMADYSANKALAEKKRAMIVAEYEKVNYAFPKISGTAWAALQGVTATIDHYPNVKGDGSAHAYSAIFGDDSKRKSDGFDFLAKLN